MPYSDDVEEVREASATLSQLTSCYSSKPTNARNSLSNNWAQS